MSHYFSMSINGATAVSCEAAGWSVDGGLVRRNMAADSVTLRRAVRAGETSIGIAVGDVVNVYLNGDYFFVGTAQALAFSFTDGRSSASVQLLGPWWNLEQLTFVRCPPTLSGVDYTHLPHVLGGTFVTTPGDGIQEWNGTAWVTPSTGTYYQWGRADDFSSPNHTGADASHRKILDIARFTSARGFTCDPNWTDYIANPSSIYRTMQAEIKALVTYALWIYNSSGLGLTAPFTADLATLTANMGASASPRYRPYQDRKVAELIIELMAVKPDASIWWDYSAGVPVMHMGVASEEVESELTPGLPPLRSLDAAPRTGLTMTGVVIRWEYTAATAWPYRGWKQVALFDKYPLTCLAHEPGVLVHSVDFDGSTLFLPTLAESLYNSLSPLRATGTLVLGDLTDAEALAIRPGMVYRVAGDELLSQAQLLIQETRWNPMDGSVTCSLGYPRALDLQTLRDLRGWATMSFSGPTWNYTQAIPTPL